METISNIATSASKLIYGEPKAEVGQEPVSGLKGRGTADEPYDSGNLEGNPEMAGKSAQEAHGGVSDAPGTTSKGVGDTDIVDRTTNFGASGDAQFPGGEGKASSTGADPTSSGSTSVPTTGAAAAQGGAIRPEHDTAGTGVTSIHSDDPHGSDVRPTEANSASSKAGGFGTAEPSVGADPASGQQAFQKQQGGDKPTAEPASAAEVDKVKEKKDEGEEALKKRDPNDRSGEPLKMHDGSEKREVQGSGDGGKSGEEKGTGEKHVKTSGFKADGGDFDAAKPGAGREADRLLEQKGVHKSSDSDAKDEVSPARSGGSGEGKTKTSMGTKIKEKLHIGSKHKNNGD